MAYAPHALVALTGGWTFGDMTAETWSFGIRVSTGDAAGGYLQDPQSYADTVGASLSTWFGGGASTMANQARLTSVKVNNITPDGHYADTVTHGASMNVAGGQAISQLPALLTLAWTFETGKTGGRARRGRCYPPTGTNTLTAGVTVPAATVTQAITACKSFLNCLLINEPGTGTSHYLVRPMVFSRLDGSHNTITKVSVDSVIDVQRRRKKRVQGTRTTSVWP